MAGQPCEKCGGTGLAPREGEDAEVALHPVLAAHLGICNACGGNGLKPPIDAHAANRAAAKAEEG